MKLGFLIVITVWVVPLLSQDSLTHSPKAKLIISGYADLYFQYDFNEPADKLRPPFLYNFKKHDQLNVNLALLKGRFESKKFRANLGLMAGNYATYNLAAEPEFFRYIYEANIGYKFSNKFSLDAGILPSHLGCESAIAKDNWNLSRSMLAENSPYYETGIKFSFNPNDKWSTSFFVLNGWQNIKDNNSSKAVGTQVQFKPSEKLIFNSSSFIGNEKPDSAKQVRLFHNFYTTYSYNSRLNATFLFDIGCERKIDKSGYTGWMGTALLIQYVFSEKISSAARIEYYQDPKGVIISNYLPAEFKTTGFAMNFDYRPFKNMALRTEIRSLKATNDIFIRNNATVKSNFCFLSALALYF